MFPVIDLLSKSFIQQEKEVGEGQIWAPIQLRPLSGMTLDDVDQLSQLAQN